MRIGFSNLLLSSPRWEVDGYPSPIGRTKVQSEKVRQTDVQNKRSRISRNVSDEYMRAITIAIRM